MNPKFYIIYDLVIDSLNNHRKEIQRQYKQTNRINVAES